MTCNGVIAGFITIIVNYILLLYKSRMPNALLSYHPDTISPSHLFVIECGKLPLTNLAPLILNGTLPNITDIPWHASIYYGEPNKPKRYRCGATIIQENLLITAAHCVYDENTQQTIDANNFHILAGNIFRDYDSSFHNLRIVRKSKVKNIYIRCDYQGFRGNYMSDIAILELVEPFILSPFVVPICIDYFSNSNVLEAGIYGKVVSFAESSSSLKSLIKPYIPLNECKSAGQSAHSEQFITIDKFCAGYRNDSSACDGDSGGGLVFKTDELWYLRGITSVSLSIERRGEIMFCNSYILYTRISNYIEWIQDVVRGLEQNLPIQQC